MAGSRCGSKNDGGANEGNENCLFCDRIFQNVQNDTRPADGKFIEERIYIGQWDEVMVKSGCAKHVPFVEWALKDAKNIPQSSELHLVWSTGTMMTRFTMNGTHYTSYVLASYDKAHPERSQARLTDDSWVDSDRIRNWKEKCDSLHGEDCQGRPWIQPGQVKKPARLIDVRNKCLVETPKDSTYVALSYVWGSKPFYTTLKDNLVRNQQPEALTSSNSELELPISPVVLDAMGVVQVLGERYLWADALCIVQDDEITKRAELDNMGQIYSHATVTIVAALGSGADSGLPGFRGFTAPRKVPQDVYHLSADVRVVRVGGQPWSIWKTRAWTYQEEMFSRRVLIVEEQIISWRCGSVTWDEDRWERPTNTQHRLSMYQDSLGHSIPIPSNIGELIYNYNERLLTNDGDALDAFAGIASILSRGLVGGLISGLPEVFFYLALLWQPCEFAAFRDKNSNPDACLPSWSWVSYRGALFDWPWHVAGQFACGHLPGTNAGQIDEVFPLVQWNCHQALDSPGEEVRQTWQEYRDPLKAPEAEQLGWARHLTADDKTITLDEADRPGSLPEYFYTHKLAPGFEYWWPVPLSGKNEPLQPQRNVSFISGRTRRGWLQGAGLASKIRQANPTIIQLRSASGAWAGAIGVMAVGKTDEVNPTTLPLTEKNGNGGIPDGLEDLGSRSFELVEVARGTVGHVVSRFQFFNFWDIPVEQETPGSEVHYVMWIIWEGKVAYRRGLGRVLKSVWETLDLEWIDLILG